MRTLRKGTSAWTCVPNDPSTLGDDPMCLDPVAMEWLHASMKKASPLNKMGFIYMMKGGWDFSNTDPFATTPHSGKPTITGPHVMIVGPAAKSLPGYDRTGEESILPGRWARPPCLRLKQKWLDPMYMTT
jgi:hypothetical protein